MTEYNVLQEMALNRREITHPVWGSFSISRPTNRILGKVETAKTRSLNKDLQSTLLVTDPGNSNLTKEVPAILTRRSKEKVLRLHQEWTDQDDEEMREATTGYQTVCFDLEEAGFTGIDFINLEYDEIHARFKEKLGSRYDKHAILVKTVIPTARLEEVETLEDELPEEVTEEESVANYVAAKTKLENILQDLSLSEDFKRLDILHKQYLLYLKGIFAQTRMYTIKLKEITLFSDTVEARAEKEGQLTKLFECVRRTDRSKVWDSVMDCEESSPEFLSWLLREVERFQNLDPTEGEQDERVRNRFNFLFPLGATTTLLGESDAQRKSNPDGVLPEETPSSSSEDSDTTNQN